MQIRNFNPPIKRGTDPTMGRVPFMVDGLPITFTTGKGTEYFGAIVYVKMTCESLKQFARACHAARVVFKPSERDDEGVWDSYGLPCPIDGRDAYEVYAGYEQLERLTQHSSVKDWHAIGFLNAPKKGSGAMPKKR